MWFALSSNTPAGIGDLPLNLHSRMPSTPLTKRGINFAKVHALCSIIDAVKDDFELVGERNPSFKVFKILKQY